MSTTPDEWERHYDEGHGWWYRFNTRTGESQWEGAESSAADQNNSSSQACSASAGGSVELGAVSKRRNVKKKRKGKKGNEAEKVTTTTAMSSHGTSNNSTSTSTNNPFREEDGFPHSATTGGAIDDDDDMPLITDRSRVYAETEHDISCYYRLMFVTACLFEAPLAVLEGSVRAFLFFCLVMLFIVLAIVREGERDYWYIQAKKCARETLLCVAIILTFLVPFSGCFVYRKYKSDEREWDIAPMPTVLGWVDTRRFFVFCWGGGSLAVRGSGSRGEGDDDDDDDDLTGFASSPFAHTPLPHAANDSSSDNSNSSNNNNNNNSSSSSDGNAEFERVFDIHMRTSRDSWQGGIPCAPRKVSRTVSNIMSGDEAAFGADSSSRVEEQVFGSLRL